MLRRLPYIHVQDGKIHVHSTATYLTSRCCRCPCDDALSVEGQLLSVLESETSTNLTADDLPGPGRLLGNLYVALGTPLERRIGQLADKLGYGPRATAIKIKKRRHLSTSSSSTYASSGNAEDVKDLKKSLKRMLKYTGLVLF